jgi:hypothetical protein
LDLLILRVHDDPCELTLLLQKSLGHLHIQELIRKSLVHFSPCLAGHDLVSHIHCCAILAVPTVLYCTCSCLFTSSVQLYNHCSDLENPYSLVRKNACFELGNPRYMC